MLRNAFLIASTTALALLAGCPRKEVIPLPPGAGLGKIIAGPASRPAAGVDTIPLDHIGVLVLPGSFALHGGKIDLLIHFHGSPERVISAAAETGIRAALVLVNRAGLSSAYEKPFSDPQLFTDLLNDARVTCAQAAALDPDTSLGRVYLSSFSAGFGAIRAVLRAPEHVRRIDGIVMADSLYCGYENDSPTGRLDDAKMVGFRRFAAEAAAGGKFMLLTHTEQVPPGYASTAETASDLIRHVGARRMEDRTIGPGKMQRLTRAHAGEFYVLGYAGPTGDDHGDHLRQLAAWYKLTPLSR